MRRGLSCSGVCLSAVQTASRPPDRAPPRQPTLHECILNAGSQPTRAKSTKMSGRGTQRVCLFVFLCLFVIPILIILLLLMLILILILLLVLILVLILLLILILILILISLTLRAGRRAGGHTEDFMCL